MGKLSDVRVRQAKPDPDRIVMIGDGDSLYLRIYPSGTKTWMLRDSSSTRDPAKSQALKKIGTYPDLSLRDARRKALTLDGKTAPVILGKGTVPQLAEDFYNSQIAPRYRRPEQLWRYLERDLAEISGKRVVDITRAHLAQILRSKTRDGPVAANRLLAIIRRMFRYAVKTGVIDVDPSSVLDRSVAGGSESPRERVLTDDEIRALWKATEPGSGTPKGPQHSHGPLLRFVLICGQRIAETQAAKWTDIDETERIWRIPKEHTKSRRAHWVALPDLALEVLKSLPHDGDDVFPKKTATGAQAWLRRWCNREKIEPFTPHDLRRTVATRMNDLGVRLQVVEKHLNHKLDKLLETYNRAQYDRERREAMELWANTLRSICASESNQNGPRNEKRVSKPR